MTTLPSILSDLLHRATHAPGIPARTTLKNGLRVDVMVLNYETGESETFLQLHRPTTFPSHQEWQTVLKHWPYPRALDTPYTPLTPRTGGFYLKASWITPVEPEQAELFQTQKPGPKPRGLQAVLVDLPNDLKTIRQELNTQKKSHQAQAKTLRAEVQRQLLNTLNLFNLAAWKLVASKIRYSLARDATTWDAFTAALAEHLTTDEFQYLNLEDLDRNHKKANELLTSLGLKPLPPLSEPVSTETPQPEK